MKVSRKGDWLSAKVGDELVMMSAERGSYLGVTEIGAVIWAMLETPQTFDALCERLLGDFEVEPETCRSEVRTFLADLAKQGAIELEPPLEA